MVDKKVIVNKNPNIVPFSPTASKLTKEYTAVLSQIGDQCAYTIQVLLKQYLRFNIEVIWQGLEFQIFRDFINDLPQHCCIHILRTESLQHYSLFAQNIDTVFSLMERLLGARKVAGSEFEFTNINTAIISRLTLMMLREIQQAFAHIIDISWQIDRQESSPTLASVLPDKEHIVVMNFSIRGDVPDGTLKLCLAALDFRAPLEQYKKKMDNTAHKAKDSHIDQHLYKTNVRASVHVGKFRVSCNELRNLRVGDIIKLDTQLSSPANLLVEGTPKYTGKIGKVASNWAFTVDKKIDGD